MAMDKERRVPWSSSAKSQKVRNFRDDGMGKEHEETLHVDLNKFRTTLLKIPLHKIRLPTKITLCKMPPLLFHQRSK